MDQETMIYIDYNNNDKQNNIKTYLNKKLQI